MSFACPARALSREEVRRVDQVAIAELGVPGVVLMENAGLGLTDLVETALRRLGHGPGAAVGIVAGKGNNGGDGFVLARHLALRGYAPRVVYAGGPLASASREGDAGINLTIAEGAGLPLEEALDGEALTGVLMRWQAQGVVLLADALYGTGLRGALREPGLGLVQALDGAGLPVVAVDLPSGLDCDSGQPLGAAVHAMATATFVAPKLGFEQPGAAAYTGAVTVVPIGCPARAWSFLEA